MVRVYQPKPCPIAQQLKGLVINQFLERPEVIEILRKIASKNNSRIDTEIFSGGEEAFASGALEIVTVVAEQMTLRELLVLSYDDLLAFCRGRMFYAKNAARSARDPYTFEVTDEMLYTDVRIGSGSRFRKEDDYSPEEKARSREVAIAASEMPELREWTPDSRPDPVLPAGWAGDNDDASSPPARHADPRRASLNEDYAIAKIDGTIHEVPDEYERAVDVLGTEVAAFYWDLKSRELYPQRHSGHKAMTSTERSRLRRWRLQILDATTRLYK